MLQIINMYVNGRREELAVDIRESLLETLREKLNLTSVKKGCGVGECGACTVLVDGVAVDACLYLTMWADGKHILTTEGLKTPTGELNPIQQAFVDEAAVQCGFCTPGLIMTAVELMGKGRRYTREELRKENACVQVEGCAQAAKLHLAHALTREESLAAAARCRLIVTYSEQRAREIQEGFRFYDRNTVLFPAKDLIFYQADLRGRELDTERIRCLRRLMEGRPVTAVTTFSALMTPQVPLEVLRKSVIEVRKRGELSLSETAKRLVSIGYEKQYQVEKPGQFAIRGDILDIFELTEENPYRIELWGDEVDSIRSFDVLSQRSLLKLESVRIISLQQLTHHGQMVAAHLAFRIVVCTAVPVPGGVRRGGGVVEQIGMAAPERREPKVVRDVGIVDVVHPHGNPR